jgi:hypothetical protein
MSDNFPINLSRFRIDAENYRQLVKIRFPAKIPRTSTKSRNTGADGKPSDSRVNMRKTTKIGQRFQKSCRRLATYGLVVLIAACSSSDQKTDPSTRSLAAELPPAELPTYAKGDRFTYDNPEEIWTVEGARKGLVAWRSSRGRIQKRLFDPILPPIVWEEPGQPKGSRKLLEWSGSLFPLKAGNKMTFKAAVRRNGQSRQKVFVWNCYAGNPRMITIPAGTFAAFPTYCRRNDGRKVQTYYAPAVNTAVSIKTTTNGGKETLRQLIATKVGKGPRISARLGESLPGGWSTAAIAEWQKNSAYPRQDQARRNADRSRSRSAERRPLPVKPATQLATTLPAPKLRPPKQRFGAHLGSFSTPAGAKRAWRIYGAAHKRILLKRAHAVIPVDLGKPKGILYRLVAAPEEIRKDAVALCRAIKKDKGFCRVIPTEP